MKRKIVAIFVGLFIISGVLIGIIFASAQADEKHAASEEMGPDPKFLPLQLRGRFLLFHP